ncbi:pollen coat-like protein [Medicago truncatula]|uniref:Pollen coat-like protein n=1 Tax=Medicago truncatula TaxID=3880 RepID=G7KTM7_MEDTR|nr:pollen coat-like protein [Medicago truncatula]
MDQSQNISNQADQAVGQAQGSNTAQSAKESCQEAGQQMKAKAQEAADAVKNRVGAQK